MITKQRTVTNGLILSLLLGVGVGFAASPAMAENHTAQGTVEATVESVIGATFEFFRDLTPFDFSNKTPITGASPLLTFNLKYNEATKSLWAEENIVVFVSVASNGTKYEIKSQADALDDGSGHTIPGDKYAVVGFVDPGDGRDISLGSSFENPRNAETAETVYISSEEGNGTTVQVRYAIGELGLNVPAGTYNGSITLTVNER